MKKILFLTLAGLFLLTSCNNKKKEQKPTTLTEEQAYKRMGSGVCLVKVDYYYSIVFGNKDPLYFSDVSDEGEILNLTDNEEEIQTNEIFGTGFFVTKDGHIVTNAHVATPTGNAGQARGVLLEAFSEMADVFKDRINQLNSNIGALEYAIREAPAEKKWELLNEYQAKCNERDTLQSYVNNIERVNISDHTITLHKNVSVALNNTFVTSSSDFLPCIPSREDEEHDLALVRLKDKKTPEGCYIFKVPGFRSIQQSESDTENVRKTSTPRTASVKPGDKVYIIGFNLGPALALTDEGIRAQITSGTVSQDGGSDRIMYTTPILVGSSGAPVINSRGQLVAVNYATLTGTQGFNYGIKVKHLANFLNDNGDH